MPNDLQSGFSTEKGVKQVLLPLDDSRALGACCLPSGSQLGLLMENEDSTACFHSMAARGFLSVWTFNGSNVQLSAETNQTATLALHAG